MQHKSLKLFLFFLLVISFCHAQNEHKIAKDSLVWEKKKQLTWNDSTGKVVNSFSFNCYVYSSFEAVADKKMINQPSRVRVNFDYSRKRDYTNDDKTNSPDFIFSQTVIGIQQLYAKRLRKSLFKLKYRQGYFALLDSAFADYLEQMIKRDNEMRLETANGKDVAKLTEWSAMIVRELEEDTIKEREKK